LLARHVYRDWRFLRNDLATYAYYWDIEETKLILAESEDTVFIKDVWTVGELDGFVENKGWVARCASFYYKVDKIEVYDRVK
jgi:hypothetical protein